jgi:hypothetical protein
LTGKTNVIIHTGDNAIIQPDDNINGIIWLADKILVIIQPDGNAYVIIQPDGNIEVIIQPSVTSMLLLARWLHLCYYPAR